MMTNKQKLVKERNRNQKLLRMICDEREKGRAYKEIIKMYTAYIALLLNRLGATEDNAVTIEADEVTEAIKQYEVRAAHDKNKDEYSLWCVDLMNGTDIAP